MKHITVILVCIQIALNYSFIVKEADTCDATVCSGSDCRCSSLTSPYEEPDNAPQLISITIDEAVLDDLYTNVWGELFFDRVNPDGNPIGLTFYVPHEYTDYERVHDLYIRGYEIGVNSITKNPLAQYWTNATEETLTAEFKGQKTIISRFANIPEEDIIGVRTPQLQIQGDNSIKAYISAGLQYDSSWTSRSTDMYFPYTLDYASTQECRTGTTCPEDAYPGFWIAPIIDLQGNSTDEDTILECNSLTTCNIQGDADYIATWLMDQIERERSTTRAPLTLMVPSSWFRFTNNSYEGFQSFLDQLGQLNDVFLVTVKQAIDWTKNPVPASQFQTEVPEREADCDRVNCALLTANNDLRYMISCVECPAVYPWLDNPTGDNNPTTPSAVATVA